MVSWSPCRTCCLQQHLLSLLCYWSSQNQTGLSSPKVGVVLDSFHLNPLLSSSPAMTTFEKLYKQARAIGILVPILGVNFVLLPIRPEHGSTLEYVYDVLSVTSTSFQGIVSITCIVLMPDYYVNIEDYKSIYESSDCRHFCLSVVVYSQ